LSLLKEILPVFPFDHPKSRVAATTQHRPHLTRLVVVVNVPIP
jgi:hypothetical protein